VLLEFRGVRCASGVDAAPDRVGAMLAAVDALDVTDVRGHLLGRRMTLCASPDTWPSRRGFAA